MGLNTTPAAAIESEWRGHGELLCREYTLPGRLGGMMNKQGSNLAAMMRERAPCFIDRQTSA